MLVKDLKKINLLLSSCLTTLLGAIVNIIPDLTIRQICNPLAIIISFGISTFTLNWIKSFCNKKIIKNNLIEIEEIKQQIPECSTTSAKDKLESEIEKLRSENSKLRRESSKLEFI
jgi:hypothetical protein